jgi:hypothetical protein
LRRYADRPGSPSRSSSRRSPGPSGAAEGRADPVPGLRCHPHRRPDHARSRTGDIVYSPVISPRRSPDGQYRTPQKGITPRWP